MQSANCRRLPSCVYKIATAMHTSRSPFPVNSALQLWSRGGEPCSDHRLGAAGRWAAAAAPWRGHSSHKSPLMTGAGPSLCMTRHTGPQSPIIQKTRALWATRAKPGAHTQADIVRLFAQPRSAPRGFPAGETFRSHGGGGRRLLIQCGLRPGLGKAGCALPSAGRPRNCMLGHGGGGAWGGAGCKASKVLSGSQPLPSLSKESSATDMTFRVWKAQLKAVK